MTNCLYRKSLINNNKKMKVIRDYSKVVGYKDNIQKSNNFHVPVINKLNLKLKVQYHFHKHHKMKYLGVYLTKYV